MAHDCWRFPPKRSALLVIDPVNDFLSEGGADWEVKVGCTSKTSDPRNRPQRTHGGEGQWPLAMTTAAHQSSCMSGRDKYPVMTGYFGARGCRRVRSRVAVSSCSREAGKTTAVESPVGLLMAVLASASVPGTA